MILLILLQPKLWMNCWETLLTLSMCLFSFSGDCDGRDEGCFQLTTLLFGGGGDPRINCEDGRVRSHKVGSVGGPRAVPRRNADESAAKPEEMRQILLVVGAVPHRAANDGAHGL